MTRADTVERDDPGATASPATTPWRVDATLAALLSLLSTGAMLGLSNRADERFHPYLLGPDLLARPWTVLTEPVAYALEWVDQFGNFRPVGRIVEHANFMLDEALSRVTGLPLHVVLGGIRMASVAALAVAVVWLTDRLVGGRATLQRAAVALALPGLLVAYGTSSSMVIFSAMYVQTSLLVVLLVGVFADPGRYTPSAHPQPLLRMAAAGTVVALFNELAWIAVPVAAATLLTRLAAARIGPRRWLDVPAFRLGLAAAAGFAVAAVPVRLYLARVCGGPDAACYSHSNPTLEGLTPTFVAQRVVAGLPLPAYASGPMVDRLATVLVVAALALVTIALLRRRRSAEDPARGAAVAQERGTDPWWVPLAVGVALVLTCALLSSLSEHLQGQRNPWQGYREAPLLFAGWALVLGSLAGRVADRLPPRAGTRALAVVGALGVGAAVVATGFQHDRDADDARLVLAERVGAELASFDVSDAGDDRRCRLVEEFIELHPDRPDQHRRFTRAMRSVSLARHGVEFCEDG